MAGTVIELMEPGVDREGFARALSQAIDLAGRSQQDLAARLGVSPTAISHWRSGTKLPAPSRVFQLEKELDLPPGSLSSYLDFGPVDRSQSVEQAVAADESLGPEGKRAMVNLYRTLRKLGG